MTKHLQEVINAILSLKGSDDLMDEIRFFILQYPPINGFISTNLVASKELLNVYKGRNDFALLSGRKIEGADRTLTYLSGVDESLSIFSLESISSVSFGFWTNGEVKCFLYITKVTLSEESV